MGLEQDYRRDIISRRWYHARRWLLTPAVIRNALKFSGLYGRARRNAVSLRLRRHQARLNGLPAAFDGFKILQISDPHFDMNPAFPEILAEFVSELEYDICVLTGDYRFRVHGPIEPAMAGLRQLRTRLRGPVYGILGNHDSLRMVPAMEAAGVTVLLNEAVSIARGDSALRLVGIDDPHYYRTDNLERAYTEGGWDTTAVLLAHAPDFHRHAAHAGFQLMLCGHTHGGQICLPGGIAVICEADCPRRMIAGAWRYKDLIGYTSVGAGSSILDVRLNCPPEVVIHELRRP